MKTNPIPGVMDTLKEANFDEDQRMAITRSIADMQYPLLKAIENLGNRFEKLEARMDARFEKLEARIEVHRTDMKADVDRLTDRLGNQTLVLAGTVIASHLGVLAILKLF